MTDLAMTDIAMTDIAMIHAAQSRLHGHARLTPLLNAPLLDRIAGRRIFVKAECLQRTGSFKFRGAWSALTALDAATREPDGEAGIVMIATAAAL